MGRYTAYIPDSDSYHRYDIPTRLASRNTTNNKTLANSIKRKAGYLYCEILKYGMQNKIKPGMISHISL